MKIDPADGTITFADFSLRPRTTPDAVGKLVHLELTMKNNRHALYKVIKDDAAFAVLLSFVDDVLKSVTVGLRDRSRKSWEDWSEKTERDTLPHLARYAELSLGPSPTNRWQFSWGTVSCGYDPRAGAASLFVEYA